MEVYGPTQYVAKRANTTARFEPLLVQARQITSPPILPQWLFRLPTTPTTTLHSPVAIVLAACVRLLPQPMKFCCLPTCSTARRSTTTGKDLPCYWPQLTDAVPLSLHCLRMSAANRRVSPAPSSFILKLCHSIYLIHDDAIFNVGRRSCSFIKPPTNTQIHHCIVHHPALLIGVFVIVERCPPRQHITLRLRDNDR